MIMWFISFKPLNELEFDRLIKSANINNKLFNQYPCFKNIYFIGSLKNINASHRIIQLSMKKFSKLKKMAELYYSKPYINKENPSDLCFTKICHRIYENSEEIFTTEDVFLVSPENFFEKIKVLRTFKLMFFLR
ncbi:hypothetical protein EDEG_01160 [Edhazardia aedis USNM 41457]|uniref:Uncharacterized protein n=1 Tax=Edhazardia aedis (strain USNM 41457) TaxID=1003232 RepID=J8ZYB7_EDHAE|nr:hypothetical protein EDEG_01160 [Edhazardia aedis USNM 41457]|eukprot:EJW04633.1 hypothetical protein EDEG_01160 [Edhazardia aedis USNM 41457]